MGRAARPPRRPAQSSGMHLRRHRRRRGAAGADLPDKPDPLRRRPCPGHGTWTVAPVEGRKPDRSPRDTDARWRCGAHDQSAYRQGAGRGLPGDFDRPRPITPQSPGPPAATATGRSCGDTDFARPAITRAAKRIRATPRWPARTGSLPPRPPGRPHVLRGGGRTALAPSSDPRLPPTRWDGYVPCPAIVSIRPMDELTAPASPSRSQLTTVATTRKGRPGRPEGFDPEWFDLRTLRFPSVYRSQANSDPVPGARGLFA